MVQVTVKQTFDVPASQLWDLIGQFNGIADWHPAVERSELEAGGMRRRVRLVGGGELLEQLEEVDAHQRFYTYRILEGPLPVAGYTATIRVTENNEGGATVEWSSEFEPLGRPAEVAKLIQGIYERGFENLRKMFGG
ncbi:MAG: SRPBCC family protein [Proteobacteria bacterium]|nr:SRPBCC family protein [Pseudomonadota bacterium]